VAPNIKTDKADRLARELALRAAEADLPARMKAFAGRIRPFYDRRPASKAEWDWASGDQD